MVLSRLVGTLYHPFKGFAGERLGFGAEVTEFPITKN